MTCLNCGRSFCGCGTVHPSRVCPHHHQTLIQMAMPLWKGSKKNGNLRIVSWYDYLVCPIRGCGYSRAYKLPARFGNRKTKSPMVHLGRKRNSTDSPAQHASGLDSRASRDHEARHALSEASCAIAWAVPRAVIDLRKPLNRCTAEALCGETRIVHKPIKAPGK